MAIFYILVATALALVAGYLVRTRVLPWLARKLAARMIRSVAAENIRRARESGALDDPVPPFRIELEPVTGDAAVRWKDRGLVNDATAAFESARFRRVGDFDVEDGRFRLRLFLGDGGRLLGSIGEYRGEGTFLEVDALAGDGPEMWSAMSRSDVGFPQPPNRYVRYLPDVAAAELIETVRRETDGRQLRTVADDEAATVLQGVYADGMDWLIERGGPTEEEFREIARNLGHGDIEDRVDEWRFEWQHAIHWFRRGHLEAEFQALDLSLTGDDTVGHSMRLIYIYDGMSPFRLGEEFPTEFRPGWPPEPEDEHEEPDEAYEARRAEMERIQSEQAVRCEELLATMDSREAFATLVSESADPPGFRRLAMLEKPLPADVWLRPLRDDEGWLRGDGAD